MKAPLLNHDNFVYTRLKALVWTANGTTLPNLFQAAAGDMLSCLIEEEEPNKPLLINCRGIVQFDDHALDSVKLTLRRVGRPLILAHAGQLEPQLKQEFGAPVNGGADIMILGANSIQPANAEELLKEVPSLEQEYVNICVADCFHRFANGLERMSSTPLLASGIFDARPLISDPQKFVWISLLMADRLEQYLDGAIQNINSASGWDQNERPKNFRLLAVSLRGSPIAAAVGLLTGRHKSIEIIDHMGPKYKILEEHSFGSAAVDADYIFVGDFIVGGTELRIAQAYARSKGCMLKHAVVIGCLLKPDDYQSGVGISYLVNLRACCPTAIFRFI